MILWLCGYSDPDINLEANTVMCMPLHFLFFTIFLLHSLLFLGYQYSKTPLFIKLFIKNYSSVWIW